MSSNNNNNNYAGEIHTIRNILMGEQIAATSHQFKEVEDRLVELEGWVKKELAVRDERIDALKSAMQQMEADLRAALQQLQDKTEQQRKADKVSLGKLLGKVAEQLTAAGES